MGLGRERGGGTSTRGDIPAHQGPSSSSSRLVISLWQPLQCHLWAFHSAFKCSLHQSKVVACFLSGMVSVICRRHREPGKRVGSRKSFGPWSICHSGFCTGVYPPSVPVFSPWLLFSWPLRSNLSPRLGAMFFSCQVPYRGMNTSDRHSWVLLCLPRFPAQPCLTLGEGTAALGSQMGKAPWNSA